MSVGLLAFGGFVLFVLGWVASHVYGALHARHLRQISEQTRNIMRTGKLREAREALAAITRYPTNMEHVQKVAKAGLALSEMPEADVAETRR